MQAPEPLEGAAAAAPSGLQVDFYVLPSSDPQARITFACKLVDKAWRLGHRIAVLCADSAQRSALDERLWAFKAEAFIAHSLLEDDAQAPVALALSVPSGGQHDLLINLKDATPSGYEGYARLAEIVLDDPALRQAARDRFRFYRERGYALHNHRLTRF
ncbi:DNA polymerase III subunit chi [Pseudomonas sp. NPDC007930]|uniref:DNA polymerase III subunit chi n=1 Tax=Pseudomonas sp. NPDC007930 TaxID=3364417 RepID=UPI0036EC1619